MGRAGVAEEKRADAAMPHASERELFRRSGALFTDCAQDRWEDKCRGKREEGRGQREEGRGKREVGSGKWEVGSGKWEVGSGKWEVGSGKWEEKREEAKKGL
jgi:hypothetical protein